MQIREIRWKRGGEEVWGRILPGPGMSFLDGSPKAQANPDFLLFQTSLVQDPEALYPASGDDLWQFFLADRDRPLSFSSDRDLPGRRAFFSRTLVGAEARVLSELIDYSFLSDSHLSRADKRSYLEGVWRRLADHQKEAFDPLGGGGRLSRLEEDIRVLRAQIAREGPGGPSHRLPAAIEEGERELQALKMEDGDLAFQQQQEKFLAIKTEYEALLDLRQELKETEEREGAFGSRITGMGHNITVHELTELARMRQENRKLKEELEGTERTLEEIQRKRMRAEQDRIMVSRRLQEAREEASRPLEEEILPSRTQAGEREDKPASGSRQILWMGLALLLVLGLFMGYFYSTTAYILAGLALLGGLALAGEPFFRGERRKEERAVHDPPIPAIRPKSPSLALLASLTGDLDQVMDRIRQLDEEEARLTQAYEILGRQARRQENDLLRQIRPYAGPSEADEVDEIILTLSRQRDSSAQFNERVADLLRQIADLKHGRSDEEMIREYDRACAMLYGDPQGSGLGGQYLTSQLKHDPDRARRLYEERMDLAARIDGLTRDLADMKKELKEARETTLSQAALKLQEAALRQSWEEEKGDYQETLLAASWLEEILAGEDRLDFEAWMDLTLHYLARLTGRRPQGPPSLPQLADGPGGIRPPRLSLEKTGAREVVEPADRSLFKTVPAPWPYLASRLAQAALEGRKGQAQPLLWVNPSLPAGRQNRDYLLDSLEEWGLATGGQSIYFTDDPVLLAMAGDRRIKIYAWS